MARQRFRFDNPLVAVGPLQLSTDEQWLGPQSQRAPIASAAVRPVSLVRRLAGSIAFKTLPRYRPLRHAERENRAFDVRFGTQTSEEDGAAARDSGAYRAIPGSLFSRAMASVGVNPQAYAFVDYGSGAGKALLLASEHGFKEIVGIESSKELHERACANLDVARLSGTCPRAVHADVAEWLPPKMPLVCFFFNPSCPNVVRGALRNLAASWDEDPRPIHIVYVTMGDTSQLGGAFDEFPLFRSRVRDPHVHIASAG